MPIHQPDTWILLVCATRRQASNHAAALASAEALAAALECDLAASKRQCDLDVAERKVLRAQWDAALAAAAERLQACNEYTEGAVGGVMVLMSAPCLKRRAPLEAPAMLTALLLTWS